MVAPAACGEDEPKRAVGPADPPAKPPPGWRTVTNREAGLTLAVPRGWPARTRGGVTSLRSRDGLLSAVALVDRSAMGETTPPGEYARQVVGQLPGFEGSIEPQTQPVRGSPYPSGQVEAAGRVEPTARTQQITVAAFRSGRATYSVVVFRNARVALDRHDRSVARLLASLRG